MEYYMNSCSIYSSVAGSEIGWRPVSGVRSGAAGISGRVPHPSMNFGKFPGIRRASRGLAGHDRIEPREGRVEQRDSADPAVGGAVKPHLLASLRGVKVNGEDVRIASR